jgi:hypothetical protein
MFDIRDSPYNAKGTAVAECKMTDSRPMPTGMESLEKKLIGYSRI